ncbi:hypothetical protein DYB32_010263, partial [Aphanomyces invadans]
MNNYPDSLSMAGATMTRNMMKNMFRESDDESSSSDSSEDERPTEELLRDGISNAPLTADNDTLAYTSHCHDFQVLLKEDRKKGIAHQLWPAATFLSHYLEKHAETMLPTGTKVLELGAGIGLCGLVCHKLHATSVILTDLPVAMPLLETNIRLNTAATDEAGSMENSVRPMVLSWGSDSDLAMVMESQEKEGGRLLCVAADCVYWEHLFEPFFHTVRAL